MANVDERTDRSVPSAQAIRAGIMLVLVALLAWWAAANNSDVEVDWLVETTDAPLVVVILISAAAGFAAGLLIRWRHR